jgi:hypothetical protein
MARQQIVWTALPNGRVEEGPLAGRWRVSLVASPRLTPQRANEQQLGAFPAWLLWPETLQRLQLDLRIGAQSLPLEPLALPDADVWKRLFDAAMPVAGFRFKDMSQVNLRSFPVRNVLGFARRHYGQLAVSSGGRHPALLPYGPTSPLTGMLSELGTRVDQRRGRLSSAFDRFHPHYTQGKDVVSQSDVERRTDRDVFDAQGCICGPQVGIDGRRDSHQPPFAVRALPPDWEGRDILFAGEEGQRRHDMMQRFVSAAEYTFYQADRFYRRTAPTAAGLRMRRPDFKDVDEPLAAPELDFHRVVASYGDHPALMRALGLVVDCVLPERVALDGATDEQPLSGRMLPLVKGDDDSVEHACLQTAWQATPRRFVAAARSAEHADGLLALARANDRHEAADPHRRRNMSFDVYQVDPDGTALKTVNYLLTAQNLIGKSLQRGADGSVTYTTGDEQPVAALRSAGLGVSHHGRAGSVAIDAHAAALKNAAIEQSPAAAAGIVLFMEDVLRGYRVDVQQVASGRWLSLCERSGRYRVLRDGGALALGGEGAGAHEDEGYVKAASTTGNGRDDDHYLHESLFRWAGWSLVAPRPGRSLLAALEGGMQTERVASPGEDPDIPAVAEAGDGLDVRFTARKGSLPRLRFGESYRFRARLVDLAGNSLRREDPGLDKEEQASDSVQFARFEPVGPPALVLRDRLSEGESLERMVIRSNFDVAAEDYLASAGRFYTPPPGGTALPDFDYRPVNLRHVVPPKAAQLLCEQHGCFDQAIGAGDAGAVKTAYAISARESGSLMDPVPGAQVELVTPSSKRGIATVEAPGELIAAPDLADASRDRFAAGQYMVHREDLVPIPYLPDPAAGGIALHGVPGLARLLDGAALQPLLPGLDGVVLEPGVRAARVAVDDTALADPDVPDRKFRWVLLIDFDTDRESDAGGADAGWPDDRRSLRIALHDQPDEVRSPACAALGTPADPPKWDPQERTLHLFLPEGRIARLQYASFLHDRYLTHLGLPQWVDDPGAADRLCVDALAGNHWMVTPFRRLVLVHATQQPVCVPTLLSAFASRRLGSTFVELFGKHENVTLHGPTTGHFEVLAAWSEWVDDPTRDDPALPGPRRVTFEGALGEIRLAENHANVFAIEAAVEAQRRIAASGGGNSAQQLDERADAPGNRHEFGDTRFRRVRYRLRAVTRFREYLPPDLYAKPENVRRDGPPLDQARLRVVAHGGGIEGDPGAALIPDSGLPDSEAFGLAVPASAPPDAPRIVYTLPTFRWTRAGGPGDAEHTSVREGDALRIYLDRPWFSSGDGEMLAVVLAAPVRDRARPFNAIPANQSDRVTQWGLDPLWDSRLPSADAEAADFPLRVSEESVSLPEGGRVLAVAHRVAWSDDRQLWYCDIEIAAGSSYMPFVRLALARYQPNALPDAKLSAIVLADFAQVLPRRRAVIRREGTQLTARLHGPVPTRGPMRNRFQDEPADSPYASAPLGRVPPGMTVEMGDNRVELVLQTRDPAIDSDLAWRDEGVLATGPAQPGSGILVRPRVVPGPAQPESDSQIVVDLRSGPGVRFDRSEPRDLNGQGGLVDKLDGPSAVLPGSILPLLDPAFWEKRVTLPADAQGPLARLVLREFERYYSDQSVQEARLSLQQNAPRRRVVNERLVYAEYFTL